MPVELCRGLSSGFQGWSNPLSLPHFTGTHGEEPLLSSHHSCSCAVVRVERVLGCPPVNVMVTSLAERANCVAMPSAGEVAEVPHPRMVQTHVS